jgi:putative MATE family efflux protein
MARSAAKYYLVTLQDLTTGSISRHLLKTTSFMLVTMVTQTLYFLVDLYWVGRLGKEALAGVGIAGNLMFIVLAISQMLGVGTTTLVSHAAGRREREHAQAVFNQSLTLAVLIGGAFLLLVTALRTAYVNALSPDASTAANGAGYLVWFVPAMALQFPMVVMGAALRGTGNFKPGMIVQTATVVVNMILAPVLMFGWLTGHPAGVAGAAQASLIAIAIGTVWLSLYFIPKTAYLNFAHADFTPRIDTWSRLLKIGLPAGTEFALIAVYLFIVYTVTRPFGAAAQAGFGIGLRLIQAGFMPVVALGFAAAPVAGQNFGARAADRVRRTFQDAALMAGSVMLVLTVACQIAAGPMVRFFSADPAVIAIGSEYLRIVSWTFVGSGIVYVNGSMFQAMGNTIPPLVVSIARIVLVAVAVFLLVRLPSFNLRWIWYLSAASIAFQLVLNLLLLRREFRLRLRFDAAPAVRT